tara:strand:+ start:52 stop:819 length:768 start_codon:yes stop_codon:yes gene_type:complete
MAISVDKVYQKVLALANKEQRGYITPQEFNLFADQAQLDIFEQYFYDLEQRQRAVGNDSEYSDISTNIDEKISLFEQHDRAVGIQPGSGECFLNNDIGDLYRLGVVKVSYAGVGGYSCVADQIQVKDLINLEKSALCKPTKSRPVYIRYSKSDISNAMQRLDVIKINPIPTVADSVYVDYIRTPKSPNWTYLISQGKAALYNGSAANLQNFELHPSEESNLVIKILQLAGVSIKDFDLTQMANQEEIKGLQQEKI